LLEHLDIFRFEERVTISSDARVIDLDGTTSKFFLELLTDILAQLVLVFSLSIVINEKTFKHFSWFALVGVDGLERFKVRLDVIGVEVMVLSEIEIEHGARDHCPVVCGLIMHV
jgi:hypothetical protein